MNNYNWDFNAGASKAVDDPRSERDVSDRVNAFIDAAFFAKRAEYTPVGNVTSAGVIGEECLRKIQFGYLRVPIDEGRITGKTLRIFDVGHRFEDAAGEWLRMAGFVLDTTDPATGKQYAWRILDNHAKGFIDGILRSGPIPMAYPALWECKALNAKGWQEIKKRGLAVAKPLYAAQVAINQAYLELHQNPALFTAMNKDTSELHHELVPFDQSLAQSMSDRMAMVVEATRAEQLLPRAYSEPTHYRCGFCDYKEKCWSLKR